VKLLARTDWTSRETGPDGKSAKPSRSSPKEKLTDDGGISFGISAQEYARRRKEAMRSAARKRRAEYAASRVVAQMPLAKKTIEVFETSSGIKAYRKTVSKASRIATTPTWQATAYAQVSLPFVSILR